MLELEERDSITIVRLAHGKASALDLELLQALRSRLASLRESKPGAVVLTGSGSIFSAGVDLFRLLDGGSSYIEPFLQELTATIRDLFLFPRPVISAVNGHAIAGGCILALAGDYRLMAEGKGRIGVPELQVGVPFPTLALELFRFVLPPQHLQEIVYGGKTYLPDEARSRGLVDEVVPPGELMDRAAELAHSYAAHPAASFALTKQYLRQSVVDRWVATSAESEAAVLRIWNDEESHRTIRNYLDRTIGRR
jgi:enoyl-CoA hydratase